MTTVTFRFGQNWQDFSRHLSDARIEVARSALVQLAGNLEGHRFLDIGCGSGLSSLAAYRQGATVVSFDADPDSVACTRDVRQRYGGNSKNWCVLSGSVLDRDFIRGLAQFDVVYAWGVLHHTGDMWRAIENAATAVAENGTLVLALYRKTSLCPLWKIEKRLYSAGGPLVQIPLRTAFKVAFIAGLLATGRNPAAYIRSYKSQRGMSWHHDVHDWLGGTPYESAEPNEVVAFLRALNFDLITMRGHAGSTVGLFGSHCVEYVFRHVGT
jgi:2-polyprenyl-6-hydroxyphenyl methylase/3-demethylubiquinone-9 3-methyltransferase